jgi:hypothetical protein
MPIELSDVVEQGGMIARLIAFPVRKASQAIEVSTYRSNTSLKQLAQ